MWRPFFLLETPPLIHTYIYCRVRIWAQLFIDWESNFLQWSCPNYSPLKLKRKMWPPSRIHCNIMWLKYLDLNSHISLRNSSVFQTIFVFYSLSVFGGSPCLPPACNSLLWKEIWHRKLQYIAIDFMTQWSNAASPGHYTMEFTPINFQWYFRFFNATLTPLISVPTNVYICISTQTSQFENVQHNIKSRTSDSRTSFVTDGYVKMLWAQDVPGGW